MTLLQIIALAVAALIVLICAIVRTGKREIASIKYDGCTTCGTVRDLHGPRCMVCGGTGVRLMTETNGKRLHRDYCAGVLERKHAEMKRRMAAT